jgi:hydroxymethylpyrimidine/phosphomethylpyrimidine kinase
MLALGLAPAEAASRAVEALAEAVETGAGYGIGHGHGAVNHFAIEKFRII